MSETFVFEELPQVEPTPEPEPEPTQPAQDLERSEVDMLKEIAEQYPNKKEARKHVKEILAQAKSRFNREFSKANAYKAIREKCKFTGEKGKVEAKEATAKIEAPEEIELPIEETPQDPAPTYESPAGEWTPPPPSYQAPNMPFSYEQVKAELTPIQERATAGILNNVFEIAGVKGEGNTALLNDQDSRDLVVLMPYIMRRLVKADMTQENFENLTIGLYVGNIATKAFKAKASQLPKKAPTAPKPAQTPPPAEPTKEKPAQEPALQKAQDTNKPFLKTLEKMK